MPFFAPFGVRQARLIRYRSAAVAASDIYSACWRERESHIDNYIEKKQIILKKRKVYAKSKYATGR